MYACDCDTCGWNQAALATNPFFVVMYFNLNIRPVSTQTSKLANPHVEFEIPDDQNTSGGWHFEPKPRRCSIGTPEPASQTNCWRWALSKPLLYGFPKVCPQHVKPEFGFPKPSIGEEYESNEETPNQFFWSKTAALFPSVNLLKDKPAMYVSCFAWRILQNLEWLCWKTIFTNWIVS